jgi:hypothetical protein
MKWNGMNVLPPLGRRAVARGNTDGGLSVQLLFKHKSGEITTGTTCLHNGEVAWIFPGNFDDDVHIPESKNEADPAVGWMECPSPAKVFEMMDYIESLQDDGR